MATNFRVVKFFLLTTNKIDFVTCFTETHDFFFFWLNFSNWFGNESFRMINSSD